MVTLLWSALVGLALVAVAALFVARLIVDHANFTDGEGR